MYTPRWAYIPLVIAFLVVLGGVLLSIKWSVGWGMVVIGVGILAIAGLALRIQSQFLARAFRAEGIVIAHKKDVSGENRWFPVVRYTLPTGQEVTFQSRTSASRLRRVLPVSTKVGVLYDPARPERAIINSTLEKSGAYVAALFAIALMFLGTLILLGLIPR